MEKFDLIHESLNPSQKKAVAHTRGALLITAVAGSGKTRVITMRITQLIKEGVAPESIVALTFTNKAAREMKERVAAMLQLEKMPTITTFHGYCLNLLRRYGNLINLPSFTILDSDDQTNLVTSILKRNNLEKKFSAKTIVHYISSQKNSAETAQTSSNRLVQEIAATYEKEKTLNKSLDFDDLLIKTEELLQKIEFRAMLRQNVRHVLVDEYQDTNILQHKLLKDICAHADKTLAIDSLCVVGDEDQSIYAWRGATVANILNFPTEFVGTQVVTIEQNYRSAQQILDVANHVIRNNKQRTPKRLWSGKIGNGRVALVQCSSGYQEGDVIVAALKQAQQPHAKIESAAVLYRAHYQSRIIEEALIKNSIPYIIVGGIQFYERKEIKDLLAYLKLIVNPFDRVSFIRIINCPPRGLGQKFEELMLEEWSSFPDAPFHEICHMLIQNGKVSGKKAEAVTHFTQIIEELGKIKEPSKALEAVINSIGYQSYLRDSFEQAEADTKIDNVKELQRAVAHLEESGITSLEHLLQEIALVQDKGDKDAQQAPVFLMTCHAAKGLEFDLVILSGLEEGIFPTNRSGQTEDQIQEERRLLYVGITRAKERLIMTRARYRQTYGSTTEQVASRFISEMPEETLTHLNVTDAYTSGLNEIIRRWFSGTSSPAHNAYMKEPFAPRSPLPTTKNGRTTDMAREWKQSQPIKHATFGTGTIETIEKKGAATYVTARFKDGIKKIRTDFLEQI